jgi:phosphatidylinositol alpha-mannosyltransferase
VDLLDDPARRGKLAARGRSRAARWDWPEVARRVLQVYEMAMAADPRLLAGAGPRRSGLIRAAR